jgi:hypothetical protein
MTIRESDIQIQACRLWQEAHDAEAAGCLLEAEALYTVAAELGYDLAMNSLAVLLEDVIHDAPARGGGLLAEAGGGPGLRPGGLESGHAPAPGRSAALVHPLAEGRRGLGCDDATPALAVAVERPDIWWALEGVDPPPVREGAPACLA